MKILLANIGVSEKNGPFVMDMILPTWRKNFDLIRRPGTELVLRTSEWGIHGMDGMFNRAMEFLNRQNIFQICKNADKEGFDAVLITCFGDPMIDEMRAWLDIPVMGIGESAMRYAAMMGKKFGIVHVDPRPVMECEEQVKKYGLENYCAGIVATTEPGEAQPMALVDAHSCIESFKEAGRRLIDMGAEVIIPACGLMSPSLRVAPGCEDLYPNGFTEVDGVPILDVLSVGLKFTEMAVGLKEAGCSWISRSGFYAKTSAAEMESGKLCVEDDPRITYWDAIV